MLSIYFSDVYGNLSKNAIYKMEINQTYNYKTKKLSPFKAKDVYDIGDILIGNMFLIFVSHENINIMDMEPCNWDLYISFAITLLMIKEIDKVTIYTNNNNTLFKYNSVKTTSQNINSILDKLSQKFKIIEVV